MSDLEYAIEQIPPDHRKMDGYEIFSHGDLLWNNLRKVFEDVDLELIQDRATAGGFILAIRPKLFPDPDPKEATIKAFVIPDDPFEIKSKDVIKAQYTQRRTPDARDALIFRVVNMTKVEKQKLPYEYQVELWESADSDIMIGSCSCEARTICKHIGKCVEVYRIATEAGFLI